MKFSILILSQNPVDERMSGPSIRCWEFSKVLSTHQTVTLAAPKPIPESLSQLVSFQCVTYSHHNLLKLAQAHDILLVQGFLLEQYPFLKKLKKIIIVDLYDPFLLESLENHKTLPLDQQWEVHQQNMTVLMRQILCADYMICASEKQKDYWLGMLSTLFRVNPNTYQSGDFRHLIGVVPFGVSEEPFKKKTHGICGKRPGFGVTPDDFVLLWGGGIWDWLDPFTPIQAVAKLASRKNPVKLFFLGQTSPDPNTPKMQQAAQAIQLAKDLGIYQTHALFNPHWVPYEQRASFLGDAHVGISCHLDHLETRFAFRTRMLDYIWAKIPIIASEGDTMAQWIGSSGAGKVVRFESVDDWVEAILSLQQQSVYQKCKQAVSHLNQEWQWNRVMEPLITFCENPHVAADTAEKTTHLWRTVMALFPLAEKAYRYSKKLKV